MKSLKLRLLAFVLAISMICSGMAPALDTQAAEIQAEETVQQEDSMLEEELPAEETELLVEEELSTEEEALVEEEIPEEEELPAEEDILPEETVSEEQPGEETSVELEPIEVIAEETPKLAAMSAEDPAALSLLDEFDTPETTYVREGAIWFESSTPSMSEDGIAWDAETRTLTLTDVTIVDEEDYCTLELPTGSTIVSKGTKNCIVGINEAICSENLTITGSAPLYIYSKSYGFEIYDSLTIDGTSVTVEAEYNVIESDRPMDEVLVLKGGIVIKSDPCTLFNYEDGSWTFVTGEDFFEDWDEVKAANVKNLEFAVTKQPVLWFENFAKKEYAGKAEDSTLFITLTVEAQTANTTDPVTYQWYQSSHADGTDAVAVDGATSASLVIKGAQPAGTYYLYCQAKAGTLTKNSTISKVTLNTTGRVVCEEELYFYDDTASVDELTTYGYKWDKSTATLTLDSFVSESDIEIGIPATIVLTGGTTNRAERLYMYDDVIIKGDGVLVCSSADSYSYIDGYKLTVAGGADVTFHSDSYRALYLGKSLKLYVMGAGSRITATTDSATEGAVYVNATDIKDIIANSAKVTTPADAAIGNYYIGGKSAKTVLIEPSTDPCIEFTAYPQKYTTAEFGDTFTLTATAGAFNMSPAPEITYKWYDVSGNVVSTAATFTVPTTETYANRYHCVASATYDGEKYTVTGMQFVAAVLPEGHTVYTDNLDFSTDYDENGGAQGFRYDASSNTLILDNCVMADVNSTRLALPENAVIYLPEGTKSVLYLDMGGYTVFKDVTIMGGGTLEIIIDSPDGFDANSSNRTLKIYDSSLIITNIRTSSSAYCISNDFRVYPVNSQITLKAANSATDMAYIAELKGCEVTTGTLSDTSLKGVKDPVTNWSTAVISKSAAPYEYILFSKSPETKYIVDWANLPVIEAEAITSNTQPVTYKWYDAKTNVEICTGSTYSKALPTDGGIVKVYCKATSGSLSATSVVSTLIVPVKTAKILKNQKFVLGEASITEFEEYGIKYVYDATNKKGTLTLENSFLDANDDGAAFAENLDDRHTLEVVVKGNNFVYAAKRGFLTQTNGVKVVFTGGGNLSFMGKNDSYPCYDANSANVEINGGTQIYTLFSDNRDRVSNRMIISDKGSAFYVSDCYGGNFIVRSYSENDFAVQIPEEGYIAKNGTTYAVYDKNGTKYTGDVKVTANFKPEIEFTSQPKEVYEIAKDTKVTLSVKAKVVNYEGVNPTYEWFDVTDPLKEVKLAVGESCIYTGKAKGVYKVICRVTALNEGFTTIKETTVTTINVDTVTTPINLISATKDESGLGWSWDNAAKILTLKGVSMNVTSDTGTAAISLPANSKIIVQKGTVNTIISNRNYSIYCSGALDITGGGKLIIKADNISGVIRSSGGMDIKYADITVDFAKDINAFAFSSSSVVDVFASYITINYPTYSPSRYNRFILTDTVMAFGRNTPSSDDYYAAENTQTNGGQIKLEPIDIYFTDGLEEIRVVKIGKSATFKADAVSKSGKKLTYTWYQIDQYDHPDVNPVKVGTAQTFKITAKTRGIKYYYCNATDGTYTARSKVFAVVTPAKGAKARTYSIALGNNDVSCDMLATEGWAWDKEKQTLTLSGIDLLVPFSEPNYVLVDRGVTVVLEGTNYLDYEDASSDPPYIRFYGSEGDSTYTFTGGGTLYCDYIFDAPVNKDELIIKNGVKFVVDDFQYDQGPVTVDGAQLIARYAYVKNLNNYEFTLKNDAYVEITDDIEFYAPLTIGEGCTFHAKGDINTNNDVTIEAGGLLGLGGKLNMDQDGGKVDRVFTVFGTLSAANNFVIRSTAETPVVMGGTSAVIYPTRAELVNYDTTGYKYQTDGVDITGKLVISDETYDAAKVTKIGAIVGKANADTVLKPGALTPAGATAVYTWQWADTKNGTWKDISTGSEYVLETRYHDKYIRVKAMAYGAYEGEVYSAPIGPVVGNPTSLIGLHGVGLGGSFVFGGTLFNGDNLTYNTSRSICDDGTYRYIAVPAKEKAVITIRNLTTGFESVGTTADVEMAVGTNNIEIEVAYGGETRVYKITHEVSIPDYTINFGSYAEGVTLTATWKDTEGIEQTKINTYNEGRESFKVPRGTEVTITSTAPYGKRVAAYSYDARADLTKESAPYTFIVENDRYFEVDSKYLAAIAPQNLKADWMADEDHIRIEVAALEIPGSDPVAYYNARVVVCDENGHNVAVLDSDEGNLTLIGDIYQAVVDTNTYDDTPISSAEQYTVKAYYTDLYNASTGDYILAAQQEAIATVESRREVKIDVSREYIVIKGEDVWNDIDKPEVELFYNGYYGSEGFEIIISDGAVISEDMTEIFTDADRTYLRIVPVNPAKDGTAYITIKAKDHTVDGKMTYVYKTIRVDVNKRAETPTLNLGTTSGTLNVYNNSAITVPVYGMECGYEVESAVFKDAAVNELFEIEVVNGRTLRVTPKIPADADDMDWAAWAKTLNGKTFKSQITVNYNGISSCSSAEMLAIKIANKAPAVKVSALKFNSFFAKDTKPLVYTIKGETVAYAKVDLVKTTAKASACPSWLTLASDGMSASIDASKMTNGKASGKLALKIWLEGWRVPAQVSVSVSAAKTAPKLKLSKTTITVPATYAASDNITLGLVSSDKKVALADMGISDIRVADATYLASLTAKDRKTYAASVDFYKNNFDLEEGTLKLRLYNSTKAGKILILAYFDGAPEPMQIPVTVKIGAKPTFKASASKLTFYNAYGEWNGTYYDGEYVYLTSNVDGLKIDSTNLTWTITRTDTKTEVNDAFEITAYSDGKVLIERNAEVAVTGKTYRIDFKVSGIDKSVTVKATVAAEPTLKLSKTSGTLNRAKGVYGETITLGFATKEKLPVSMDISKVIVTGPDGVSEPASYCTDLYIGASWASSDEIEIECGSTAKKGKYKIEFYGKYKEIGTKPAVYNLTVTDKVPTLKALPTSVSLNKDVIPDEAFVAITAPAGYPVNPPSSVTVTRGRTAASSELYWKKTTDGIVFKTNDNTQYGVTYNVTARYNIAYDIYKDVKFTVKTAKAAAPVKVTASVKCTLDLARPDATAAAVTYKYTGWNPAQYDEGGDTPVLEWKVYAMNGKVPVTTAEGALDDEGLVAGGSSNGVLAANSWFKNTAYTAQTPYDLTLMIDKTSDAWNNGDIWPTYKYVVKTTVTFPALAAPNNVVTVKDINFTVKQGSTKFAADVKSVVLSKLDRYDRQYITITNADKDTANVAKIAEVQLVSGTTADALQVRYIYTVRGKSVYAVSWKNNQVPATFKKGSVKLNIFLEGNDPVRNKPNATLSLNVNVK